MQIEYLKEKRRCLSVVDPAWGNRRTRNGKYVRSASATLFSKQFLLCWRMARLLPFVVIFELFRIEFYRIYKICTVFGNFENLN